MKKTDLIKIHLVDQHCIFFNLSNWNWSPLPRNYYTLWLLTSGKGQIILNRKSHALMPGFGFIMSPETEVYAESTSSIAPANIAIHFKIHSGTESIQPYLDSPVVVRNRSLIYELAAYMDHALGSLHLSEDTELLEALSHQILTVFMRDHDLGPENPIDALIRSQISTIRQSPANSLSVSEMAAAIPLSEPQYTRRFRKLTGMPPAQYIIQERMHQASRLLLESTLTIEQISDMLGYRDISFFSRQFKSRNGIAPQVFRKSAS